MTPIGAKNGARVVRDWTLALQKVEAEGGCRYCIHHRRPMVGTRVESAHLGGREHDFTPAIGYEEVPLPRSNVLVAPTRIVPLCGPATDPKTCHARQEAGELELQPLLTREEEIQLTADVGLYRAYHDTTEDE